MLFPHPPRSNITLRTVVSLGSSLATLTGYALGVFRKSIAATVLNTGGYVFSRITEYSSDKEQRDFIQEEERRIRETNLVIRREIKIQEDVIVPVINPFNMRDSIGIESDRCETAAGRCSTTLRTTAYLCQSISTALNLCMNVDKEYEKNTAIVVGAAVTGVIAMALPVLENHFRKENQGRVKHKLLKASGATEGIAYVINKVEEPKTKAAIGRCLSLRR